MTLRNCERRALETLKPPVWRIVAGVCEFFYVRAGVVASDFLCLLTSTR